MSIMPERPDQKESWESYFGERPRRSAVRWFKRQFSLERKYTEKLFNGLPVAIKTEIGLAERRIMAKMEEIDTSLGLIAGEIARRANDPPSDDARL